MPRDPEWIIYDFEDDGGEVIRAATEEDAVAWAVAHGWYQPTADLVTPEMRRDWRNASRRERYAARRDAGELKSRARGAPPGFVFKLTFLASLAIHDDRGRCRCPQCGRWSIPADFAEAPTSARFNTPTGAAIVCFGPACWRCRGMERAPYDAPIPSPEGNPNAPR